MKILPDYLIEYIPYIEEALEELRLSVLDHAYELLKSLDIDELTTDDIRHKLELYDIKVENMTDAWLPNGRFYRMYPSIKHNRTRKNDLISIAQSGGQFEGVWSSDFNTKDKYNFKTISVARHYEMSSELDGYFYISGDTSRNKDGSIKNSAIKALQTDILMASALPAGYTYLYVPWPRPHYPDDSTYFYNVHMLDYDRLTYTEDCNNIILSEYTDHYPASMSYDWYTGSNTSFRTPYWFDYHYMNKLGHTLTTWPIHESGKYYGVNDDGDYYEIVSPTNDKLYSEAVKYIPTQKELYSQYEYDGNGKRKPFEWSVFPTACYSHARYRTSEPNRLQYYFTPENKTSVAIEDVTDWSCLFQLAQAVSKALNISLSEAFMRVLDLNMPLKSFISDKDAEDLIESIGSSIATIVVSSLNDHSSLSDFRECIESLYTGDDEAYSYMMSALDHFPDEPLTFYHNHNLSFSEIYNVIKDFCDPDITLIRSFVKFRIDHYRSIDENCINDNEWYISEPGPYRYDSLSKFSFKLTESLSHVKTFKPIWSEESPIFAMLQSSFNSNLSDDIANNSLKYWVDLKQDKSIINTEVYDNNYNDSKTLYTYTLIVTVIAMAPIEIISALKTAVKFVLDIDIIESGHTNVNYTLALNNNELVLKQYIDRIREKAIDVCFNPYIFNQFIKFNINPLYNKASVVRDNIPAISEITHTRLDRPTIGKLDPIYVGYTMYGSNQGIDGLGDTPASSLSSTISDNVLYKYGAESAADYIEYDPSLFYTIISLNEVTGTQPGNSSTGQEYYDESENPFKAYVIGGPSTGKLYINKNNDTTHGNQHNYVTYKTSKIHKLWFSKTKRDISLGSTYNVLYNDQGSSELYYYTQNNVGFEYNIIGLYNKRDELVIGYDNEPTITCSLSGSKYSSFMGQVAHRIPGITELRPETHTVTDLEFVPSYVINTNDSSSNHWELVTDQELNNNNIHDPSYNPDNPIPVTTYGIAYYRNTGNESLNDTSVMYITYYRPSPSTESIYILNHSGDYSPNLTADDFGYVKVYNNDTDELLVTSYGLINWNNFTFDLSTGYTHVRIEFIKNTSSNSTLDRCYIAVNCIGLTYPVEHQSTYTVYTAIIHPETVEPAQAAYVLATLKTFPGSVPVAPSFIAYVHNRYSDDYIEAYYIPEHNSISIDGGATYISMEEFTSLGYEFGAQGNHSLNYEMPSGTGASEDVDESVAFIDTETIIH